MRDRRTSEHVLNSLCWTSCNQGPDATFDRRKRNSPPEGFSRCPAQAVALRKMLLGRRLHREQLSFLLCALIVVPESPVSANIQSGMPISSLDWAQRQVAKGLFIPMTQCHAGAAHVPHYFQSHPPSPDRSGVLCSKPVMRQAIVTSQLLVAPAHSSSEPYGSGVDHCILHTCKGCGSWREAPRCTFDKAWCVAASFL